MYDEKLFRERLVQLRSGKGVSARDMSLSIGQNPGYINSIENGKTLPAMKNFWNICDYLEVTPAEFFDTNSNDPGLVKRITGYLGYLDRQTLTDLCEILEINIKKSPKYKLRK